MPKVKAAQPKQAVKVYLDPDVYAELRLRLYDPDYAYGFKHGAMSDLINRLLKDAFTRAKGNK